MYSTTNYVDPKPCSIVLQPPNTTVSNFSPYTEARQKRCKSEKHMPSTRSTLSLYWGDANILTSRSMLTTPVERRLGFFFLEMASWVPSGLSPSRERERDNSVVKQNYRKIRVYFVSRVADPSFKKFGSNIFTTRIQIRPRSEQFLIYNS